MLELPAMIRQLIFAHAGIPHFDRIWGQVHDDRRLWLDVSSPYLDERTARDAVAAVGTDRVLYGTDAPYGFHGDDGYVSRSARGGPGREPGRPRSGRATEGRGSYDYGAIRGWVERLPVAAGAIDRVLGGNIERLLAREG